jgi:aryl-alcohol dehydrogenase-like predicted oxidoreductase
MKVDSSVDIFWIWVGKIESSPAMAMKINIHIGDFTLAHPWILLLFFHIALRWHFTIGLNYKVCLTLDFGEFTMTAKFLMEVEVIVKRKIGPWNVTPIGLGCMPMSGMPHSRLHMLENRAGAIQVIHDALDAGVELLDTADIYAAYWDQFGHNELLVGEAIRTWKGSPEARKKLVIATKGGITRGPGETWGRSATRDYFLRAAEASALRLGVDQIQLWQHHRLDPTISFEDQVENILVLKERKIVQQVGVSNYNAEQLRRAVAIMGGGRDGGVVSVQNERSPKYRKDHDVLEVCEEFSIAYLPWSPLGGVSNERNVENGNYEVLSRMAEEKKVSVYALTIAWQLKSSPRIIPIPGATRSSSILDCLQGLHVEISDEEQNQINASLPEFIGVPPDLFAQPAYR